MTNSKTINLLFSALLISSLFGACKKHHHDDIPTAEITIYTPIALQEFDKGDTVFMKAKITGSGELHGYEVHLIRLADTTEVYLNDQHIESANIDINDFWVNDGTMHSDMELEVIANLDHEGHNTSKKVKFHCHDH